MSEFSDAGAFGDFRCERNLLSVRDHLGLFTTGQRWKLGDAEWMLERGGGVPVRITRNSVISDHKVVYVIGLIR